MKNLFESGQQIETTIVQISDSTVFLDLGLKSEGLMDIAEVKDADGNVTVKEGDKIKAYFLKSVHDDLYFTIKLNAKNGGDEVVENAFKNAIPVEGKVSKEIKGGFEVMLGNTRAFCPYSQMGYKEKKESSEYIGKTLTFLVKEYKNNGKNVIVSNRDILKAKEEEDLSKLSEELKEGMTVKGKVVSLHSYGAFVDIQGFQALLPISEISHNRVKNVADVLKEGDEIEVQIIKSDWEHNRVSVSTKALEKDPWEDVKESFPAGTKVDGKIARVADFGIFVTIAPGIDGLVHVSKLNVERNTNLKTVFKVGSDYPVIVEKVDLGEHKISLSPVVSNEEEQNAYDYMSKQENDDGETYNPFAALLKK